MSIEPTNRREASAVATRAALLAAAREAFGSRGYAAVSLAEIARAARATTGALYHHFADKKGLFTAVAEAIESEIVADLVRSAPAASDPWESLVYAVTAGLRSAARPGVARVIFADAPTVIGAAAWREIEMRYGFGQLHGILRALSSDGRLGDHDPALVAGIVLGATIQTVDAIVASSDPDATLDRGVAAMTALLGAFRTNAAPDGSDR